MQLRLLESFHQLLRKDVKFEWTQRYQDFLERVKNYLTSSPVLAVFDSKLPIRIYTDACLERIGAVLK